MTSRRRALWRLVAAVALPVLSGWLLGCSGIECEPGACEPCVAETCEQMCVDPDDEDIGYTCELACRDGADCAVSCGGGVSCQLACDGSTCSVDRVDAHCTDGARCDVDTVDTDTRCYASDCAVRCGSIGGEGWCNVTCVAGSGCDVSCSPEGARYEASPGTACAVSCDASSSCQLACAASCILCCNGSPDCAMDCAGGGGVTCEDGAVVCGRPCPLPPESPCTALADGAES